MTDPSMVLAQGGGHNPLFPTFGTLIAEIVGFLIVLWVIRRWVVPPIRKSMQERQDAIRAQFEESQRAKERLESAEQDYQRALDDARREASRLREEAQEQRSQIVEEARSEARERADEILARAEEQIATERRQAVTQLRDELGRMAVDLAGRVVGESLEDDARQRRVVERFLDELENGEYDSAGHASVTQPESAT